MDREVRAEAIPRWRWTQGSRMLTFRWMELQRDPTAEATIDGMKDKTTWKKLESDWVRCWKLPLCAMDAMINAMVTITAARRRNSIMNMGMTRK
jgi:hypothetical protein